MTGSARRLLQCFKITRLQTREQKLIFLDPLLPPVLAAFMSDRKVTLFHKSCENDLNKYDVITFMHQRGTRLNPVPFPWKPRVDQCRPRSDTSRWEHEGGGRRRGRNVSPEIRSNSDTFPQLMSIPLYTYVSYRFSTQ